MNKGEDGQFSKHSIKRKIRRIVLRDDASGFFLRSLARHLYSSFFGVTHKCENRHKNILTKVVAGE